jgi:hypothetical protein
MPSFRSLSPVLDEIEQLRLTLEKGGEGGIRTHGGPKDHNGFRDRPIQPLWHLSGFQMLEARFRTRRRVLYPKFFMAHISTPAF